MFFVDTWVWLEFFTEGKTFSKARNVIRRVSVDGAVINPIVLLEVKYRLSQKIGVDASFEAVRLMESMKNLRAILINSAIAKYAAELRLKYYKPKKRELSYADAIHLATAVMTNCNKFATGDPDFKRVKEIKVEVV